MVRQDKAGMATQEAAYTPKPEGQKEEMVLPELGSWSPQEGRDSWWDLLRSGYKHRRNAATDEDTN